MNGKGIEERFNAELDGLIAGKGAAAAADPAALATAGKFVHADFSAESKIREELRARLLAAHPVPASVMEEPARPFWLSFKALLPVALAAACVLLVVMPITRRKVNVAPAAQPAATQPLPAVAPAEAKPVTPRAANPAPQAAAAEPAEEEGLFGSIPMAGLGSGRQQDFPIETRKGGFPITVHEGRKTQVPGGEGIVLETDGAVFILERRAISMDDVFERKSL